MNISIFRIRLTRQSLSSILLFNPLLYRINEHLSSGAADISLAVGTNGRSKVGSSVVDNLSFLTAKLQGYKTKSQNLFTC